MKQGCLLRILEYPKPVSLYLNREMHYVLMQRQLTTRFREFIFGSVGVSIFFIQKSFEIALRSFANYEWFQAEAALTRISF